MSGKCSGYPSMLYGTWSIRMHQRKWLHEVWHHVVSVHYMWDDYHMCTLDWARRTMLTCSGGKVFDYTTVHRLDKISITYGHSLRGVASKTFVGCIIRVRHDHDLYIWSYDKRLGSLQKLYSIICRQSPKDFRLSTQSNVFWSLGLDICQYLGMLWTYICFEHNVLRYIQEALVQATVH